MDEMWMTVAGLAYALVAAAFVCATASEGASRGLGMPYRVAGALACFVWPVVGVAALVSVLMGASKAD